MAKLWKIASDPQAAPALQEIDLSKLAISSPTIVYLSGYLTTDSQAGYIAGGIRRMQELLEDRPEVSDPPQIYAWSHTSLKNVFNLAAYNLRSHKAYSAAAEKLARAVILPLVSEHGQPRPFAEAQKRLRNVTFFGYSAGTVLGQEVFNASFKLMKDMGYKAEDARRLLREVVLISTGNVSRPTQEKNRFTTLYLAATNDFFVRWKNRIWRPLRAVFLKYTPQLTIKPLSETSLLITAAVKKKMWEWRKKGGERRKSAIEAQFPSWVPFRSNHELPHYITSDDEHSQFSKIVLHALINAIGRKDTLDPLQLLEPVVLHTPAEAEAYNKRITGAVIRKKPG